MREDERPETIVPNSERRTNMNYEDVTPLSKLEEELQQTIRQLRAKNVKLKTAYDQLQEINASHCERADWFENQNKAQAKEIEKLKQEESQQMRANGDFLGALNAAIKSILELAAENQTQAERIEKLETALQRIQAWAKTYPPESLRLALEALQDICKQALKGEKVD